MRSTCCFCTGFPPGFIGVLSWIACSSLAPVLGTAGSGNRGAIFDLSLDELAEVVVTDAKIAQPRETVTRRFETISSSEFALRAAPQRNLAEILRHTSGQFVNPLSRNDANWGAYAGLGPQYNTYLLDGLPIDSFADAMSLDPWAFQAVEIHKSPASVLYSNYLTMDFAGNETPLAGTTNFILRDRIESAATRFAAGAGSYDTYQLSAYHQDRRDWLSYFVGGSFERSDYADYGTPGTWLHMLDQPNYEKSKLYAKLMGVFGDGRQELSLFVHHTDHRGDLGRPHRTFANRYDTVNLTYAHQLSAAWKMQLKSGYRGYHREWDEDNYPLNLDRRERSGVRQRIFPSDLTFAYQHAGRGLLTFGADHQHAAYRTHETVNDVTARSSAVFLQEKIIRDRWIWRVGGRLNRTQHRYAMIDGVVPATSARSWNTALWNGGARYNASPSLALFANAGSSFLAPAAKAVVGTLAESDLGLVGRNGQLPSASLRPERGLGADFGLDYGAGTAVTVLVRGFVNRVDDAIVQNIVSALPSQSRSVNAGRADARGFEVALEMRVSPQVKCFVNVTRNYSELRNSLESDQDGAEIPFVPTFVANAGMTLKLPRGFVLAPSLQVVGDYYDSASRRARSKFGSYDVLNVRLQRVWVVRGGYSVSGTFDVNNAFDRRYRMPWQFREPGVNWFGSLGVAF